GHRLGLRVIAEDPERADQVASELPIEVGVLRPGVPPEPSQRRSDEVADQIAEALARRAVQEPVEPRQAGDDRLPYRRCGLPREARQHVEERRGGGTPGDHRRPRIVDEALALPWGELAEAGDQ